jgi:hypothetical protein
LKRNTPNFIKAELLLFGLENMSNKVVFLSNEGIIKLRASHRVAILSISVLQFRYDASEVVKLIGKIKGNE